MVSSIPTEYDDSTNKSIWYIDGTQTDMTSLCQSVPRINNTDEALHMLPPPRWS